MAPPDGRPRTDSPPQVFVRPGERRSDSVAAARAGWPARRKADRAERRSGRARPTASLLRLLLAAGAGASVGLSWQPYGLWPLLLVGVPGLTLLVRGATPWASVGRGYAFGLGMLGVTLSWVHVLGIWIAVLLVVFEALFFALLGVALALVERLRVWPLAAAACWVGVEFAFSRVPFNGFGWARLGYAAVDTPLAGFFPVVGIAGVSFLVALAGQLVAWLALVARSRLGADRARKVGGRRARRSALVVAGLLVALTLGGTALRGYQVEPEAGSLGSVNVGIVQGNVPGRGVEALGRARTVTVNHQQETERLAERVRQGREPRPDFVLWPENSTDIDPTLDSATRAIVQAGSEEVGVPILVGAVMQGPGPGQRQTSALWWDPERGVLARYDKRNLVPFGEWIPLRDWLLPRLPVLRQVGAQSVPGTRPGVLQVSAGGRPVVVGVVLCFELAYDQTVQDTLTGGAQVSVVQSNNATYGGTGQVQQQFAITRARAMESRREIAVATTNSISGLVDRDGRVVTQTAEFTAASGVVQMPLRTALTPAVRFGAPLNGAISAAGLLFCFAAGAGALRGAVRRTTRTR